MFQIGSKNCSTPSKEYYSMNIVGISLSYHWTAPELFTRCCNVKEYPINPPCYTYSAINSNGFKIFIAIGTHYDGQRLVTWYFTEGGQAFNQISCCCLWHSNLFSDNRTYLCICIFVYLCTFIFLYFCIFIFLYFYIFVFLYFYIFIFLYFGIWNHQN